MVLKTKEEAKSNFEAAIAFIPTRYVAGVSKADWKTPAASDQAETNFAAKMQKVIAEKRRKAGIEKVSNTTWQESAKTKGAPIIGERIRAALDKWSAKWGPIYDSVTSVVKALPRPTIDWKTNVTQRLMPVVEAWKKASGKL